MQEVKIKNEVLNFKNTEKENKIWQWITRLGGILGILITFFALHGILFSEPKLSVQKISFARDTKKYLIFPNFISDDLTRFLGIKYLIKISLNVAEEDLNYKDIIVELEYQNGLKYQAKHFYPNRHFNKWDFQSGSRTVNLPQSSLFKYPTALQKNKTHLGYLAFVVEDSLNQIIEPRPIKINLDFVGSQNKFMSSKPKIYSTNPIVWTSDKQMETIYEPEIWEHLIDKEKLIKTELRKGSVPSIINSYVPASDTANFYRFMEGFIIYLDDKLNK